MKIKVNLSKETISIKNMSPGEFAVIDALMSHVRLGQGPHDDGLSDYVLNFLNAVEEVGEDVDALCIPEIAICAMPSNEQEDVLIAIENPTLEMYVS